MGLNKRRNDFVGNLKQVFGTDAGKRVLKYLKEDYVDGSAVATSTELTYYKLGQKEFVQTLLASLEDQEELVQINTRNIED